MSQPDEREWLEPDRLGGFAMGTVSGIRTRRYHALLTTATTPPTGRVVLVAGIDAWVESGETRIALSSHRYFPDVVHPDGARQLTDFAAAPWPTARYRLDAARTLVQEIVCDPSSGQLVLWFDLEGPEQVRLCVRPLLAVRDYHSLQHENAAFDFEPRVVGGNVAWHPYAERPAVSVLSNGSYQHDPVWFRQFSYAREAQRGLDHLEDLAAPGCFRFDLETDSPATLVLRPGLAPYGDAFGIASALRESERARREAFGDPLLRAADAYLVRRGAGLTVVAGYPWFTDWGRDTFIALRGLCLASGRTDEARKILLAWSDAVSQGMLPNRFPDGGDAPEYNAVDASLWFVVAAGELCATPGLPSAAQRRLRAAILAIVQGYASGTRYRIGAAADGLVAAGEPGVQLTWMDAKVGDRVITPRIGKPVEVQALWINALHVAERFEPSWRSLRQRATASFLARFPRGDGSLFDVVDADHVEGDNDPSFRPNQIFAVGGLPLAVLEGEPARKLVDLVERRLWTPMGLRSLAPDEPGYRGRYEGGVLERDEAYHQGTVWPWLVGPFVEAWVRVRGGSRAARDEARRRFVTPLLSSLDSYGLGHLPELADGDAPHAPRGAPFQAWSLGELLRARELTGDHA